ncbi:MAG: T9SS type A sorting domain-containing protein [Candidatus Eisenbacteria bacterium]|uniref:T9SS type A sorting domain-containing protein n=1 Tax=Eiseniibacteriota bacterium TaxID=2212470 RepID=A0A849SH01_UNCEI|nr:T9SS type A sorting domain-containing protein [Candidatus Eisenbacteria bacterium]
MSRRIALLFLLLLVGSAPPAAAQTFTSIVNPDMTAHNAFSTGGAWVDYDGDGDLDLYVLTAFTGDRNNVLYRNDGGDTFVRVTDDPMGQEASDTVCSTWADYNNDGLLDAFVSGLDQHHGLLFQGAAPGIRIPNTATLLSGSGVKSTGCAWGDYDNDGHVDLVISLLSGVLGMSGGNRLFHNRGDGTFEEVTGVPPTTISEFHHHPTWSDFDGDGDLDLFFATGAVGSVGPDFMYRNQLVETGTATFTLITGGALAGDSRDSQTLSWADYDNDGDLDCYAINYTSVPNQLYRNDGGTFTKITTGSIVTDTGPAHGVTWGDFDNDGDLDVYVARDLTTADRHYRNNGDGTFTSVTTGTYVTIGRSNYGVAAGDYDGDGDLDLFAPTARSEGPSLLFRNDLASGAHWLEVTCVGSPANRSGIGAKVRVLATIGGTPRWQMREISACTGYGSQNMLAAHFGLAEAGSVDSLIIEWPGGSVDRIASPPVDTALTIVQGRDLVGVGPRPRTMPAVTLRIAPNPVGARSSIDFRLPSPGPAIVTVHDLQGREVMRWAERHYESGGHRVTLDGARLPSGGVYLVRVSSRAGSAIARLVHLR